MSGNMTDGERLGRIHSHTENTLKITRDIERQVLKEETWSARNVLTGALAWSIGFIIGSIF